MKLEDVFDIAITNIRHRHVRSWLTILGIVIGVGAIVSLISVSLGMQQDIEERTNSLGANVITITPGGGQAERMGGLMIPGAGGGGGGMRPPGEERGSDDPAITFKEADDLRTLPGVYKLDAQLSERMTVEYQSKNSSLTVVGTEPDSFEDSVGAELADGRYLNMNDKYSAVLGYRVATQTFNDEDEDEDMMNRQIEIDGVPFRVVGYLEESGGMGGSDNSIYIPLDAAKNLFEEQDNADTLIVIAREGYGVDTVAETVEKELLFLHGVEEEDADFQVTTAASVQSTVSSIADTLGLFLGGIAAISLLVGGIGVVNTMFMSVMEQTKTIGVLKSLGAKNRDVMLIFVCEAVILGFVGGVMGVMLSFFGAALLTAFGLSTAITLELVALGIIFSSIVGIVAGVVPARNAASISPVEALRYE
jgi:putative ABC transport system permease protein